MHHTTPREVGPTGGRADQHVFVRGEGGGEDARLDAVEGLVAGKRQLRPLGQLRDLWGECGEQRETNMRGLGGQADACGGCM